jgi:AraC-like DNA-binding protein
MELDYNTLILQQVSHYRQTPGVHPRPAAIPAFFERVELVTGGRGAIQVGDDWREVVPGDLLWNKPGDYTIGRSDFDNPYRCLSVTLTTDKPEGLGLPRFSVWTNLEEVKLFTEEVVRLFQDETFDRVVLRNYVVSRLLFCLFTHHHHQADRKLPRALLAALEWIKQNFAGSCSVAEIAKAAGLSSAHLHHLFVRHLGVTPHQAVLKERLRAARERLVSSPQPVKWIAVECGFGDASSFTHVFRAAIGMTPGAYRKQYLSFAGLK